MKIAEAIGKLDRLYPNEYTREDKVRWLSAADGRIWKEIISLSETHTPETFTGYTDETDMETVLLAPWPYDEDIYLGYLAAMVHRYNGETARYNAAAQGYNEALEAYGNAYRRENLPGGMKRMVL